MFKNFIKLPKIASPPEEEKGFLKTSWNSMEVKGSIKTGVAAALSLFMGIWFSKVQGRPDALVSGLWCVVSSILVLQANLGGTYKAAKQRFVGVLIGSFLGCILAWQFGSNPISLGGAVAATVMLCTFLQMEESVRIACLTVAVIMVLSGMRPEIDLWWFGIYRFFDSSLGICLGVVVAHTLWPAEATEKIEHSIAKMLNLLSKLFHISIDLEPDRQRLDKLFIALKWEVDALIEEISGCLDEAKLELALRRTSLEDWKQIFHSLETVFEAVVVLKQLKKTKLLQVFDETLINQFKAFSDSTEIALLQLSRQLDPVDWRHPDNADNDLVVTFTSLKEDLLRFRNTQATRQFDWKEIESFFVFFYSVESVADEIFKMQKTVPKIHLSS